MVNVENPSSDFEEFLEIVKGLLSILLIQRVDYTASKQIGNGGKGTIMVKLSSLIPCESTS